MRKVISFTLAFVICACAHIPATPPDALIGLTLARSVAWESYQMAGSPPDVRIVTEMTCRNSPGSLMMGYGCMGVYHPGCVCVAGEEATTWISVGRIDHQPWHETALCHEYLHRVQELATGDSNAAHKEPWTLPIQQCNERLIKAGL